MTWNLTRSTAFAKIKDLLSRLKQRLERANVQLTHVYVDHCCRVRDKYKSVLGNVEVALLAQKINAPYFSYSLAKS